MLSKMSERLRQAVKEGLIKKGMQKIRDESGLAKTTIREIEKARRIPRPRSAYRLALACGCSEQDALALASECSSEAKVG